MIRTANRYAILGGLILTVVLGSCTQAELPGDLQGGDSGGKPVPLCISSVSLDTGIETRATDPDHTLTGVNGRIGVFLKADPANSYTAVNNRLYTYGTPFWQTQEEPLLLGEVPARLAACYPYDSDRNNPILLCSQLFNTSQDLCYFPFDAGSNTPAPSLKLTHAYARIKFNFRADASFTGNGVTTRLAVVGTGVRSVAMLDLFTAGASAVTGIPGVTPGVDLSLSGYSFPGANQPFTIDGLFIPGTLAGDIFLTVTMDGKGKEGYLSATALCGASGVLHAGKVYEVNLTVKDEVPLQIDGIKITSGWDDFNNGTPIEGNTH